MKDFSKFERIIELAATNIRALLAQSGVSAATFTRLYQQFIHQLAPFDETEFSCQTGCSFCCHTLVSVSVPEVIVIIGHLQATGRIDTFQKEIQRAEGEMRARAVGSESWFIKERLPCMFLDKASSICTIYSVRPFTCRAYHSLDLAVCLDGYQQRVDVAVPCFPDYKRSREIFSLAFERAARSLGWKDGLVELSSGCGKLIGRPENIELWLRGETIFSTDSQLS